ncbi:MAG: pentapeptide repeat-containing protein [Chromatiales bacterium]
MRDQASFQFQLRGISPEALQEVLDAHRLWIESNEQNGKPADLSYLNLRGADLQGARLQGALLKGTLLWDADLREADLRESKGLLLEQLAGANLAGAKLPSEILPSEGLHIVEAMSHTAGTLFVILLLGCAYVWLTVASTTDVALLTNTAAFELPIIQTGIPVVRFYWSAPLCLLALYIYFHLVLQRLWEALAELPAIFPDGKPLDKKVYPWLLNDLMRAYLIHLRGNPPPLFRLQKWLSIALAWWLVPGTILGLWMRYLPGHDWAGTSLYIVLLTVAIGAALLFHHLAAATLCGDHRQPWRARKRASYWRSAAATGIGVIFGLVSYGAIEGSNAGFDVANFRTWVPATFAIFGYSPFADFREQDVSIKPANWTGMRAEEIALVKGAPLRGKDIRYANGFRAFLLHADLRDADLRGIVLNSADLEGADLEFARLEMADLEFARLRGANLYGAELQGASLTGADLREARLARANLERVSLYGANLERANLQAANLSRASLEGANLKGADLRSPVGLTQDQIDLACTNEETLLPPDFQRAQRTCPEK